MGVKGDRASKEPLAIRLYAEGKGLAEISRSLDISVTTLTKWKSESTPPKASKVETQGIASLLDDWDRARQQKRGNIQRLKALFERQMKYIEELRPDEVTPPMMDTMSKLGALVERWDKVEKAQAAVKTITETAAKGGLSEDVIRQIEEQVLGIVR